MSTKTTDSVECDCCHQPMKMTKDFGVKKRGSRNVKYGVRRYHCDICEVTTTEFVSSTLNALFDAYQAKVDVKKMYKEEEDARN